LCSFAAKAEAGAAGDCFAGASRRIPLKRARTAAPNAQTLITAKVKRPNTGTMYNSAITIAPSTNAKTGFCKTSIPN
jgi:hypothetical protein